MVWKPTFHVIVSDVKLGAQSVENTVLNIKRP